MALTTPTTLAAAMAAGDLACTVTSASGLAAGQFLRIDKEFMIIDRSYVSGTRVPVYRRGDQGSRQVAHQVLAPVVSGLFSDLPDLPTAQDSQTNPQPPQLAAIGVDTTLSDTSSPPLPIQATIFEITKASACAITLPAPSAGAPDGMLVTFLSHTAAAHTVTYTAGFYADSTSSDVATFAAKAGASMTIIKYKGAWGVYALANVTIA